MATRASNHEKILLAAWRLFTQRGFHATSIKDIASAVGLPKGSVYNYFESKERILQTGVMRTARLVETELRQKVLAGTLSPAQIVQRLFAFAQEVMTYERFSALDPLSGLINDLAGASPEFARHLIPVLAAWRAVVAQKIWAYATVARIPELVEQADPLAGMIQATLQGGLSQARAQKNHGVLEELKRSLSSMVDSYVSALATGEVTGAS